MNVRAPVPLPLLTTGVPGLDAVLGGGIPKLSFNLIAGGPGTGKTTLAHQFVFANATKAQPALVFTVLGESSIKLLRYQQQYTFFDAAAINSRVRLINLAEQALTNDLGQVLERIVAEVEATRPSIVVVDSFRSVTSRQENTDLGVEHFVQTLAVHLTTWEVTSLMLGEYQIPEIYSPTFTIADGVLFLSQDVDRNSVVRKLQVVKMRGVGSMPGLHTYRIDKDGLRVYPRIPSIEPGVRKVDRRRLSTGLQELDTMMGGGIPAGDAVVVAGPTGSGKTTLTTHFVRAAFEAGEAVVLIVFEEFPRSYVDRARRLVDLDAMTEECKLEVIYLRPLDLSVDETLHEIREAVTRTGATRVVIDSLSGFEVALAPTFRRDFAESLYRLVGAVIGLDVTMMLTVETVGGADAVEFKNNCVTFLTDDIILQRYVEIDGRIRRVLGVHKMRGSNHSSDLRLYEATARGIVIGEVPYGLRGVTSGIPSPQEPVRVSTAGLTRREAVALDAMVRARETTIEGLAQELAWSPDEAAAAAHRLVALDYAVADEQDGVLVLRAVAQRPQGGR